MVFEQGDVENQIDDMLHKTLRVKDERFFCVAYNKPYLIIPYHAKVELWRLENLYLLNTEIYVMRHRNPW